MELLGLPGRKASTLAQMVELVGAVPGDDHLYADTPGLVAAIEAWWSAGT